MLAIVTVFVVFVATFVAAFLTVLIAEGILERRSEEAILAGDRKAPVESPMLLREDSLSTITLWASLLERLQFVDGLKTRLEQAQLNWSVGRLTASMLLAGSLALAILSEFRWLPVIALAAGGLLAALGPYLWVLHVRSRRLIRFEEQLPDVLDGLCRALRAGHPLAAALEIAALESMAPASSEFRKVFDEWNLGLGWEQAMTNLAHRIPIVEVAVFAAAVKLQTKSGGRLTEVLTKLSETMRESVALRGEVRSIAAHGKMTGMVLTVLPILIACAVTAVNPGYTNILVEHPFGKPIVGAAVCCLILAHFVIRKMVDIRL